MDIDESVLVEELKAARGVLNRYKEIGTILSPLEKEKKELSAFLKDYIVKNGDIETDIGTATIREVQKISFSGKDVNNLVESWLKSKNSEIKTCADMLKSYRTITKSSTLEVK